ncbi:MAG: putative DNA binding domain-containing protein [Desulfuromonadales bacterium]|nr:putative DNA binding domain-containing protein [Desulfuromonadales bacterium]
MFDTLEDLLKQINLGEDSSLELKDLRFKGNRVSEPHTNGMSDELAGMANSASGVFVLGVDDATRTITGIPEEKLDVVETWLRNICNDVISPPLTCRIRKMLLPASDGTERAVIRVDIQRSLYVHKSSNGYFHRIGSSKREMTPDLLARLFQQRSQTRIIRFDEQAVPGAPVECLREDLWQRFRTPLSPADNREFLLKLKLLTLDMDGNVCPTVSGVLLASQMPDEWLPNAYIQAVCYSGTERDAAYQLDQHDFRGPIDEQIRDACRFVEKNMRVAAEKSPGRVEKPQFSMRAVFEAIVNAVAHRDYSIQNAKIRMHLFADRLELFSPGTIPNTMTIESLPLRQATRNELLTSLLARCPVAMAETGAEREFLMDKRGEGVPIIITESDLLAGRKPEYRLIDDTELLLTIYGANAPKLRREGTP